MAWFALTVPTTAYETKIRFRAVSSVERDQSFDCNKAALQHEQSSNEAIGKPTSSSEKTTTNNDFSIQEANSQACDTTIANILTKTLENMSINDVVWSLSKNDNYYQVTFPSGKNSCEEILRELQIIGIGSKYDTTLSVLPCTLQYGKVNPSDIEESLAEDTDGEKAAEKELISNKKVENSFTQSIKSRLTVAQVVEGVRGSAILTFDFIMFVLLAGMLAALGLVENSSVILVAAMLVSPMMGPILAGTFGTVIQDRNLQVLGVKTELIGLALCLAFGFAFGIIYGSVEHWSEGFWLTDEMIARGRLRSLWVGVLIALPSGAGVALSVLGGNAGSLVGVAISASLLPPVVNAGLLWAVALTKYIGSLLSEENSHMLDAPEENMAIEALILGIVSLCLTIVNIMCIFLMGVVVLKVKEVTPERAVPNTKRFWGHDIREVRNYNRTVRGMEAKDLIARIREDFHSQFEEDSEGNNKWRDYVEQVISNDPVYQTVQMKTAYRPNQRLSRMTWHPVQSDQFRNSQMNPKDRRNRILKRSLSQPHDADAIESQVKFHSDDEEVTFRGNQTRQTTPASPSKRFTWNFPFHHRTDRQGRFVVTRTEEDPVSQRNSKHSNVKESDRNTANLYDLHELVP